MPDVGETIPGVAKCQSVDALRMSHVMPADLGDGYWKLTIVAGRDVRIAIGSSPSTSKSVMSSSPISGTEKTTCTVSDPSVTTLDTSGADDPLKRLGDQQSTAWAAIWSRGDSSEEHVLVGHGCTERHHDVLRGGCCA